MKRLTTFFKEAAQKGRKILNGELSLHFLFNPISETSKPFLSRTKTASELSNDDLRTNIDRSIDISRTTGWIATILGTAAIINGGLINFDTTQAAFTFAAGVFLTETVLQRRMTKTLIQENQRRTNLTRQALGMRDL